MKNNNYICHGAYLRNSKVYDHDFWYTFVKWWYVQDFFHFFEIFIFWVVSRGGGGKGKKLPNMKNIYIRHTPYFRNSIAYDHDFWYTCLKWWYLQVFLALFEIFIFLAVRGKKGKKLPKMKNINYIQHAPYLKNSIAYDHDFWYSWVKWWHLEVFFHCFEIFMITFSWNLHETHLYKSLFSICLSVCRSVRHAPYLRNSKVYDHDF